MTGPVIAIIGGGLSGAAVAYHLAGLLGADEAEIVVVEPRAELGRGLAYSATDPDHRLNVPDHKMTLRTDQPDHFHRWLCSRDAPTLPGGSATLAGEIFAPRAVFGTYVAAHLAPLVQAGRIRHVQTCVERVDRPDRYHLYLSDGSVLGADVLVLAATHPQTSLPGELAALKGHPALIADPLMPGGLDGIATTDRILIVGTGLTSADILATLHRRRHRGKVTALSRHGRLSLPHGPKQTETGADFANAPADTALELLMNIRQALAEDAAGGLTWHAVFDKLRAQGSAIWAALPLPERRRLLRHLRNLWDIHRFRIAPQTLEASRQMQRSGRLSYLAGRLSEVRVGAAVEVTVAERQSRAVQRLSVDRVILATGPAHAGVIAAQPFAALAALGLLRPDPLRLGLMTADDGRAVPVAGQPDGSILIAGPLARGTVGELMGAPEVIAWAEFLAREVAAQVGRHASRLAAE